MIKLKGHRLLIEPDPIEEVSKGGIVLAKPDNLKKREMLASETGTVLQVGNTCWRQWDGDDPNWEPWCKEGDRIHFVKYSGKFIKYKDKEFIVINDEDVLAVIEED